MTFKPNQDFNGNTLEWRGKKLNEMNKKQLIDIIVNMFTINLGLQEEIKQHKHILTPYS
jgi:hypothetical protein